MAKKKEIARVLEAENRTYELALILQPELLTSAIEKKLKEFEAFLTSNGGSVDMKDIWGKQDLAYRIGKFDQGNYVIYNLTLPSTFNQELDEHLRIDKDVIRFLMISIDEKYEYRTYEEELAPAEESDVVKETKPPKTHKKEDGKKTEVRDKGKKADTKDLNKKLDSILDGGDLKV